MKNKFKVIQTTALSMVLVMSVASTAMAASGAVVSQTSVEPGRTVKETGFGTGVLKANANASVTYNIDKSVVLSGTVKIDGPVLKMQLVHYPGAVFNITKVADGLFTYTATLPLGVNDKGNLDLAVNAYTVYQNGKTAGQIHSTVAGPVSAGNVHVAYVQSFNIANDVFAHYNRNSNTFDLSYTLNKVWDDGHIVASNQTATVQGTETYSVKASDPAYVNGPAEVVVRTLTPPVVLKETIITEKSYTYDRVTNSFTYVYTQKDINSKLQETVTDKTISVLGTESKDIQATYGDGTTVTVHTFHPPVLPRSLSIGTPSYSYDSQTGTYTATYTVEELFSNGSTSKITKTVTGLMPSTTTSGVVELDGLSAPITYQVPAAPSAPVTAPVVTNVVATVKGSNWTGNNDNGGNVQEQYILSFVINGEAKSVELQTNFTKNGTGFVTQHLTYPYTYHNQIVIVSYDLPFVQPAQGDNTTTK